MRTLAVPLRLALAGRFGLRTMTFARVEGSEDTTRKFLFKLHDGRFVETVLIPASPALYGERSDRHTLCVSTQVGCAYGCKFCASGLEGWKRNLGVEDIVEQAVAVERWNSAQSKVQGRAGPGEATRSGRRRGEPASPSHSIAGSARCVPAARCR